jgi:microprocessor complex subunit DGCR8
VKSIKEKKQEEQEITLLQSKASINSPNFAILDKLKSEMRKLKEIKVQSEIYTAHSLEGCWWQSMET